MTILLTKAMTEFLASRQVVQRRRGSSKVALLIGAPTLTSSPLNILAKFFAGLQLEDALVSDLNPTTLKAYQRFLYGFLNGDEPAVVEESLCLLRAFCGWSYQRGYGAVDYSATITIAEPKPKLAPVLPLKSQQRGRA